MASALAAHPREISNAPAGLVETGRPLIVAKSAEGIGFTGRPTDVTVMPDGRLLVVGKRELALGDGTRWDVFRQAEDDQTATSDSVAVDEAGRIYFGVAGGFAKVEWGENEEWRLRVVAVWEGDEAGRHPLLAPGLVTPEAWIWHSGSGPVVSWKPGAVPETVGRVHVMGGIFEAKGALFASDRTDGRTIRLWPREHETSAREYLPGEAGSCLEVAAVLPDGRALGGTLGNGLVYFDGTLQQPFSPAQAWTATARISSLCPLPNNRWAASFVNRGIQIFDTEGVLLQSIPRATDGVPGPVRKMVSTPGVLWALLDQGLVAIQTSAKVSRFEPLVGDLLNFAHPFRIGGRLWMEADGDVFRAVYSTEGVLQGFESDRPSEDYTFGISPWKDTVLASTAKGLYTYKEGRWSALPFPGPNVRVLRRFEHEQRWLIAGTGFLGWMREVDTAVDYDLISEPRLQNIYDTVTDGQGRAWLEIGSGQVAWVELRANQPEIHFLGMAEGVPQGWVQAFLLDGVVRFNIADEFYRYDSESRRIVPDVEFSSQFPGAARLRGRPTRDSNGRLWVSDEQGAAFWTPGGHGLVRQGLGLPSAVTPFSYTVQPDGVVWLQGNGHLLRVDPAIDETPLPPPPVIITHIDVAGRDDHIVPNHESVVRLAHDQNSLHFHFAAPGASPFDPVTFEVSSSVDAHQRVTRSSGVSLLSNLGAGTYDVAVRSQSRQGTGAETRFSFVIDPPWYSTPLAFLAYLVLLLSGASGVAWAASYIQRRETLRLERLVKQRTSELAESTRELERQFEENRRLSLAISQSPVGVAIVRMDGVVVFANQRFCELYGCGLRETIGHSISDLKIQPYVPTLEPEVRAALEQGESWHAQHRNERRDGSHVHVRTTLSPIRAPDGVIRHHLLLQEDISAWHAEQEHRQRVESQLVQAQKLESLGTLAGGIAHDFNNILTGILGFCELAGLDLDDPEQVKLSLKEIQVAGMRAKDLIARILTFSRQSTPRLAPVDLAETVADALKLLRASTPSSIEYRLELQSGHVMADATQIHQVVVNLCTNAIHAIGERSGQIRVAVSQTMLSPVEAAELGELQPGPHVLLRIEDTGRGMEPPVLDRIFDPFFTTKQPGEGTGLGLPIVRGIVANHKGALRVKSKVGMGTSFEIYFPVSNLAPTSSPIGVAPVGAGTGRILIVDDEETIANFVANRLRRLGYEPDVHTQPMKALSAYQASPAAYRALVTDLTMPGMNGIELIRAIRADGRTLPVVMVSGYGAQFAHLDPARMGRCLLLPKPFHGDDLARALSQVIASEA